MTEERMITLEQYEVEMRAHLPMVNEEGIKSSVSFYRECIEKAKETGQVQQPIDVRTLEPIANVHPDGRIEFIRGERGEV